MKINGEEWFIVTPWHNPVQLDDFKRAWRDCNDDVFVFQCDSNKEGCAVTKNNGIESALARGADGVVILDDDCFPADCYDTPESLIESHIHALQPQNVEMVKQVTIPASRGTPYFTRSIEMPVAASMGFWIEIGDYDACAQLVHGARTPMQFKHESVFGQYFALCGMNLAFRPKEWFPWYQFVNVPRFDDIWQGFLWQKEAYRRGYCFNLNGPTVRHSRQSNVWANLRDEAPNLERNETIWRDIHGGPADYHELRASLGI